LVFQSVQHARRRLLFAFPASAAEFERALRKDRQLAGIRRYRNPLAAEGCKPGRTLKAGPARMKGLEKAGKTARDTVAARDLSKASAYRAFAT